MNCGPTSLRQDSPPPGEQQPREIIKALAQVKRASAVVNQAIGNSYKGRLDRIESRVRGELMAATVACPVLGDISTRDCLDHHTRKFAATNPQRRMLARACPECPHNTKLSTKERT